MRHGFLDAYSHLDSPVHRLTARGKLLLLLLFTVAVVVMPTGQWEGIAGYTLFLGMVWATSRLPFPYVLSRSAAVLPVAILIALFRGKAGETAFLVAKAWLTVTATILVTATTPFPRLLQGLERIGLPRVMTMTLSFMYRYLFILVDEAERMERARASRMVAGRAFPTWKAMGAMLGSLFLRSYERGERVYLAMTARGYSGEIRLLEEKKASPREVGLFLLLAAVIILIWMWGVSS